MKLISKDKLKCTFLIEGVEYWFVNSLRRMMINEVPVLAIEEVEFKKNDSAMYDEMVALRLGLLPLSTNLKELSLKEKCQCKGAGCSMCQVKFTLKEKGPKMVYSKHIKCKDPGVTSIFPDIPITYLDKGQHIEFEAIAELGIGKEHMKWSPGLAYYQYDPIIKINSAKVKDIDSVVEICPRNVFEKKAGKLVVNEKNRMNCHLCRACTDLSPGVTLDLDEDRHLFTVESWGQLSPKDIVLESTNIFEGKLQELSALMKE